MYKKWVYAVCFVLVLCAAGSASAGLVAHWAFDEGSGATVQDSSGNNHHGTITGNPDWISAGMLDGAFHFDGSTYVTVSDEIGTFEELSVALWFKYDSFIADWNSIWHNNGWTGGWLHHMVTNYAGQDVRVQFAVNGAGDQFGVTPIETDVWYHSTVTYDSTSGEMIFYLTTDAERTANVDVALTVSGPATTITAGQIGGWEGGRLSSATFDDVRMYDRILTAAQIEGLVNGIPPAFLKAEEPSPADGAQGVDTPLLQWGAGDGAVSHNVYFGTNPTPGEAEFIGPQGWTVYWHAAGLIPGTTYYWRIDEVQSDGSVVTGDVWSFTATPLTAWNPSPADGATEVMITTTLSWSPGKSDMAALKHHVFFGTDAAEVADGTGDTDKGIVEEASYDPGRLKAETVYYFRVNEVEADGTEREGDLWSFETVAAGPGKIVRQWWLGLAGVAVSVLTSNPDYPDNPDG
ncbi:MAG: LamG domain-containing protein, partial [Phycisphaerales bacterium]